MQQILNVIEEAASQNLITLDEFKVAVRVPAADSSKDSELQMIIDGASLAIAKMCNRVFGFEKVEETFYHEGGTHSRMFLSRWPVKLADIEMITFNDDDILPLVRNKRTRTTNGGWVLEEKTGTLYQPWSGAFAGTIDVVYSGGYKLPDEVPEDLKRAVCVAARDDYYVYLRGAIGSGVRMLSHKHARVMFYPPQGSTGSGTQSGGTGSTGVWKAVDAALRPYIRHWV